MTPDERLAASECNAANICVLAANCPFAADCRKVEGLDDTDD